MPTLSKPKDSQKWQGLPPRRKNDPKLFMQRMWKRFNERTGTAMSRLRTPSNVVSFALKMRSEGMGIRASGRGEY